MTAADDPTPVVTPGGAGGPVVDPGSIALDAHIIETRRTFQDMMSEYDIVSAHPGVPGEHAAYVVMAERDPGMSANSATSELGSASFSPYVNANREEWVGELRDRLGLLKWYRMKRSDGAVRGALRVLKTPIQSAHWFVEPASDSSRDKNVAKFVEENLFENLNVPWSCVLDDILLMCDYGYMVMEKVFEIKDDGKVHLKKLAPRHPMDVLEWMFDANGGPNGVIMDAPTLATNIQFNGIPIPIAKLCIFSLEPEAGDLRGISVLRSAYKHWYYKDTLYKIDAIQKERHGIGVPVIVLPPNYSQADKLAADQLGRNIRANERAHIVLPPGWTFEFAKLMGQPVDCLKSIDHHNEMIKANILAPFMDKANVQADTMDMFFKSTRYIATQIAEYMTRFVIKQLVDFNYSRVGYPKLKVRRIGEWDDARTLSFAVRNYVGAGIITPDDELEKATRLELDLPMADPKTARVVRAPQEGLFSANRNVTPGAPELPFPDQTPPGAPGAPTPPGAPQPGPPRQGPPPAPGTGSSRVGTDRSGAGARRGS